MIWTLLVRRLVTMVAVGLLVLVGFAAIRVAAVWTAQAAPLRVSPTSTAQLEAAIADEQARSAALSDALGSLAAQTDDLATALDQAQTRMASDTHHARSISARLTTAKQQLARIQAAIARARTALTNGAAAPRTNGGGSAAGGGGTAGSEDDEPEHDGG